MRRKKSGLRMHVVQENDGRWLAQVEDVPGVLAYGVTETHAKGRAHALSLRLLESADVSTRPRWSKKR